VLIHCDGHELTWSYENFGWQAYAGD